MFLLASLGLVASFTWRLAKWAGLPSKPWRALPTLAVALAATIPALTITSTWANIDAGIVCFHVGMTLAFALWWHTGRISHLIIAAILAGFALGTKYTAAVPVFVLGLGVLLHKRHALTGRVIPRLDRIKGAFLFAIISGVLGGVWYSSNFREVGNPLYPLANGMFEAPGWPPESQAFWEAKAAEKGVGFEWSKLGAAWRGATFRWAGGEGVGPGGFEEQSIGFAPWLLAPLGLAGLFLIAIRRGGWWWFYLAFIAVNFALWFATYQSNRLLLSTLLIALPGCVVGLAYIAQWWRPLWIAATVSLGVACAYQGLWIARYLLVEQCAPQLALGFWSDEEWLSAKLNYYDATNAIRRDVPEDEKVLVIGESRRFHFPPNVVMSDWFDPPVFLHFLDGSDTSADVSAALRAEGVTHILINFPELLPRAWWPTAFGSGMLLHDDGTIDSARWWRAFVDGADLPAGSNLAFLRERLSDTESHLLSTWLSSVPHEIIWHGDQPHTLGVELWELSDTAAPE
jgi:hypothetical protein